jgi:dipeptidyl aminopeptidase/acylaminoacyl peptidase
MRFLSCCLAALALTIAGCAVTTAQPGKTGTVAASLPPLLPVRAYVADLDETGAYQLSPDGRQLMWSGRLGLGPGLFVQDLASGRTRSHAVRGTGLWARDSRHVLLHMDASGDENSHVLLLDTAADGLALRDLTPFPGARSHLHAQLDDSPDLLIESNRRDPRVFDLYRWVQATGELQLLAQNPGDVGLWLTDGQGRLQGRAAQRDGQWAFETPTGSPAQPWQTRFQVGLLQTVRALRMAADGSFVWALSDRGRDKLALVKLGLDGSEQLVFADPRVDVGEVVFSPRRHVPLAVALDPAAQEWQVLDAAFAPVLQGLAGPGPGPGRLAIGSISDDETLVVASRLQAGGGAHLLYRRQDGGVQPLAQLASARRHARSPQGTQQPLHLRSRDGLDLHGYLTLPAGHLPQGGPPLPTVLLVHGGPWARDRALSGDPFPDFLANRGYAVLQLNYGGSTGYGRAFRDAAQGEFAGAMHADLIDGLDLLVRQGITDPTRVAIVGTSYGGYAALVGMTFTPERFACGISKVGMSDLVGLIEQAPPYWALGRPMWTRFVGDPDDPVQRQRMQDRSPLWRAAQAGGPILLLHGARDPRVKLDQSLRMADALRAAGKPVQLEVFPNAGHGFFRWQDRMRQFRLTEDFLAGCLGGRSGGFDLFEIGAWLL